MTLSKHTLTRTHNLNMLGACLSLLHGGHKGPSRTPTAEDEAQRGLQMVKKVLFQRERT